LSRPQQPRPRPTFRNEEECARTMPDRAGNRGHWRGPGRRPVGPRSRSPQVSPAAARRQPEPSELTSFHPESEVSPYPSPERIDLPSVRAAALGRQPRPSDRPTTEQPPRTAQSGPAHHPPGNDSVRGRADHLTNVEEAAIAGLASAVTCKVNTSQKRSTTPRRQRLLNLT
jgi:hypothetical protein